MASEQKVVLVTGCSSGGIGFSLQASPVKTKTLHADVSLHCRCEQFALRGCKVYATARNMNSMEGFSDATTTRIERLTLDVTSEDDVQRVVAHVVATEGRIDVVVNNAGVLAIGEVA
jgi:1-acylglycerone phosphate reductase